MRSLDESRQRWSETVRNSDSIAALQRAVKFDGASSPCEAGCRSVCWKTLLLFRDAAPDERLVTLRELRADYAALCDRYMEFVRHPERLAELTVDPLADDPESPWDTFRRDDVVRAEILQDVRRLPDDPFYHQEHVQTMILDVLFVYCKQNPDAGGYRQGMHELLAPIVYVLDQDAIDIDGGSSMADEPAQPADKDMAEVLDARFVEHDAYALFSKVMSKARSFYEISSSSSSSSSSASASGQGGYAAMAADNLLSPLSQTPSAGGAAEESAIVQMSKSIHEGTLMKVDPELATHLKQIEILPQIFLIRWIRLLFGREFPFDQLLVLWDGIFAFDPGFDLIPLICVAMLLRIRWQLLEADYSVALPLLLKYPAPQPPQGPHTFVDDAVFLRDHLDVAGGTSLVLKYTGRTPVHAAVSTPRASLDGVARPAPGPASPTSPASAIVAGLGNLRHRTLMTARSPGHSHNPSSLSSATSPSRFVPAREGVESLFQGAAKGAKGVLERGEKLGINQAVRDAVGEIRRNMMQGLQDARQAAKTRAGTGTGVMPGSFEPARPAALSAGRRRSSANQNAVQALAEMERRNRQLAIMLDETVEALKAVAVDSKTGGTKEGEAQQPQQQPQQQWLEAVEIAAAKVQFVKVHLEDSSLALPLDDEPPVAAVIAEDVPMAAPAPAAGGPETVQTDASPSLMPAADVAVLAEPDAAPASDLLAAAADADRMDTDEDMPAGQTAAAAAPSNPKQPQQPQQQPPAAQTQPTPKPQPQPQPPAHTIPSRATLAQSSFAWMLEPGDTPASNSSGTSSGFVKSNSNGNSNSSSNNNGRGTAARANSSRPRPRGPPRPAVAATPFSLARS